MTLKARLASFTTLTRSKTLSAATDLGTDLYHVVSQLYRSLPGERRRIRLLGVQASGLEAAGAEQLALLHGERWGDVERALDRIEERFGRGAATPGLAARSRPHDPTIPGVQISGASARLVQSEATSPHGPEARMPLNDHEQKILDEIERRLAEDDPPFVEQVGRTDLYTHLVPAHPRVGVRVRRRTAPALPVRRLGVVRRRRVRPDARVGRR